MVPHACKDNLYACIGLVCECEASWSVALSALRHHIIIASLLSSEANLPSVSSTPPLSASTFPPESVY